MKKVLLTPVITIFLLFSCSSKNQSKNEKVEEPIQSITPETEGMHTIDVCILLPEFADSSKWDWQWDGESLTVGDTITVGVVTNEISVSWEYLKPGDTISGHVLNKYKAVIRKIEKTMRPDF